MEIRRARNIELSDLNVPMHLCLWVYLIRYRLCFSIFLFMLFLLV